MLEGCTLCRNYVSIENFTCICLINIYNTFILSTISYCNTIWGHTYCTHLHKLIILQKKAILICTNSSYMTPSSPLFKKLCTLKLLDINKLQICSPMQRFNTHTLSLYLMNMFSLNSQIHSYPTRNANKYHRWKYNSDYSRYSLRHSGPLLYNNVECNQFNISFNNTFRRQYKKHLICSY